MVKAERLDNPMRSIKFDKLALNVFVGEAGDRVTRASKVLAEQKSVFSKASYAIRSFGVRRNDKITVHAYC